jgi:hypothetical protein
MVSSPYDINLRNKLLGEWVSLEISDGFEKLADRVKNEVGSDSISGKIAYIFIQHQIMHEVTKSLIKLSNLYVQGEIWPIVFNPAYDEGEDKMTGWYIDYFVKHCIECKSKKEYVEKAKRLNQIRNKVAHNLTGKNEVIVERSFDEFEELYIQASKLASVCIHDVIRMLNDLVHRVDFEELIEL